jgi:hypothetical protein
VGIIESETPGLINVGLKRPIANGAEDGENVNVKG